MADELEGGVGERVLEYQRREKVFTRASGGLMLMAWAVGLLFVVVGLLCLAEEVGRMGGGGFGFGDVVRLVVGSGLPLGWAAAYMTMAILFKRRVEWAGWVAMGLTGVKLAGWLVFCGFAIYELFFGRYREPLGLALVLVSLMVAIAVGFGAVVVEVGLAMRGWDEWVEAWRETKGE